MTRRYAEPAAAGSHPARHIVRTVVIRTVVIRTVVIRTVVPAADPS